MSVEVDLIKYDTSPPITVAQTVLAKLNDVEL